MSRSATEASKPNFEGVLHSVPKDEPIEIKWPSKRTNKEEKKMS